MTIYEYVTTPTGTVHLTRQFPIPAVRPKTLCGLYLASTGPGDVAWVSGDETASGIAATCGTCRKVAS